MGSLKYPTLIKDREDTGYFLPPTESSLNRMARTDPEEAARLSFEQRQEERPY